MNPTKWLYPLRMAPCENCTLALYQIGSCLMAFATFTVTPIFLPKQISICSSQSPLWFFFGLLTYCRKLLSYHLEISLSRIVYPQDHKSMEIDPDTDHLSLLGCSLDTFIIAVATAAFLLYASSCIFDICLMKWPIHVLRCLAFLGHFPGALCSTSDLVYSVCTCYAP